MRTYMHSNQVSPTLEWYRVYAFNHGVLCTDLFAQLWVLVRHQTSRIKPALDEPTFNNYGGATTVWNHPYPFNLLLPSQMCPHNLGFALDSIMGKWTRDSSCTGGEASAARKRSSRTVLGDTQCTPRGGPTGRSLAASRRGSPVTWKDPV